MRVIDLSKCIGENAGIMAFGFFDSIHLGHQAVIRQAVSLAREINAKSSVFLFKNNIFPLLGIEKHPIYTFEERIELIRSLGVDSVFYVDADQSYLSLSPIEFISDLKRKVRLCGFTCGVDFSFGALGCGRARHLEEGIGGRFSVLDLLQVKGQKISSERVKSALLKGDLSTVFDCLGREFSIVRKVEFGRKDGGKLGFPTVNTALLSVPLRSGVYFTDVKADGKNYRAVTNVGAHPTFADMTVNIESHLLDFEEDLYGKEVTITFLKYHRMIERFDSPEMLAARIAEDVSERRAYD